MPQCFHFNVSLSGVCVCVYYLVMSNSLNPMDSAASLLYSGDFLGRNTGVGSHSLLQGFLIPW